MFIKNAIANFIFDIGVRIMNFGSWLHKKLNTPTGQYLIQLDALTADTSKKIAQAFKEAKKTTYIKRGDNGTQN